VRPDRRKLESGNGFIDGLPSLRESGRHDEK
jgi:hypothetical protein